MHVWPVIAAASAMLLAALPGTHCGGVLRKCCPLSERLNSSAVCVPELDVGDTWRWFPAAELEEDNATIQAVLRHTNVLFGAKPACSQESFDLLAGSGLGHYRLFLDEARTFRLNASKESSLLEDQLSYPRGRPSLSPDTFCLDSMSLGGSTVWVALVCPCEALPCVRKCCHDGQGFDTASHACVALDGEQRDLYGYWSPPLESAGSSSHFYRLTAKNPECPEEAYMLTGKRFLLLADGSLQVSPRTQPVPRDQFCGDYTTDAGGTEVVFACRAPPDHMANLVYLLYGAGMVLSATVLLATVVVQWMVHAANNLHGRLALTHNSCLVLGFVLLSALQLGPDRPHSATCSALAFIIQFSFLAAFFWLNVMCIDISWAFSGFRPPQGSVTERDRKKFLYYSLYAWGSPTVISIVTAIMEYVEEIPDTYIKPNFGVRACWFETKPATLAYFYGPMAALLLMNFALFLYTTIKIVLVQRATRILHNGESGRHDGSNFKKDKKRLMLYGKLFCLMGLTWITEIVSWATGSAQHYWYVTDGINLLRAVFIFIIFCCKPKVFRLLKQRLHQWGLFPSLGSESETNRSGGTRKSSSSTQQSSLQMSQLNSNTNP